MAKAKEENGAVAVAQDNNRLALAKLFGLSKPEDLELVDIETFEAFKPTAVQQVAMKAMNLGGDRLRLFDLPGIKNPSGDTPFFNINGSAVKELVGIVLEKQKQRAYYKSEVVSNAAPDCSSFDMKIGRGDPSDKNGNSEHPQFPSPTKEYQCSLCPWDKFESAHRGKGKRCKESETLFFLRQGDIMPYIMSVPPTGLAAWREVKEAFKVPWMLNVIKISLSPAKSADGTPYQKMQFETVGVLPLETIGRIKEYFGLISQIVDGIDATNYDRSEAMVKMMLPAPEPATA